MKMVRFTGMCTCMHSWEDHEKQPSEDVKVTDIEGYRVREDLVGLECAEDDWEDGVPQACYCPMYWDMGWGSR